MGYDAYRMGGKCCNFSGLPNHLQGEDEEWLEDIIHHTMLYAKFGLLASA